MPVCSLGRMVESVSSMITGYCLSPSFNKRCFSSFISGDILLEFQKYGNILLHQCWRILHEVHGMIPKKQVMEHIVSPSPVCTSGISIYLIDGKDAFSVVHRGHPFLPTMII